MQISVCLGAILIPEYLDFHSGYSAPKGAFHSTKITGSNFRNFRWSNGTRPTASCFATQGMLGETLLFENGGLFEHFRGFRAG